MGLAPVSKKTFKQYWQVEQHESFGNLRLTGVAFASLQLYNNNAL